MITTPEGLQTLELVINVIVGSLVILVQVYHIYIFCSHKQRIEEQHRVIIQSSRHVRQAVQQERTDLRR